MVASIARTVEDGTLAFHGFGSPLVQLALLVAKGTHAPDLVLVAGATYGINPKPPFLTPTSNDWVMDRGAELSLDIEELFDLAGSGRMGRMFLSGLQIDKWGNCNVTMLGKDRMSMKLPGGGGGCNLSCDAGALTLWTGAHASRPDPKGRRRYRLVDECDFITNFGHRDAEGRNRASLGHLGGGPEWLVTDMGVFDFDEEGHARLCEIRHGLTVEDVQESTGFPLRVSPDLRTVPVPDPEICQLIRRLDPLGIHLNEIQPGDRALRFAA